jgi:hypothetical protein
VQQRYLDPVHPDHLSVGCLTWHPSSALAFSICLMLTGSAMVCVISATWLSSCHIQVSASGRLGESVAMGHLKNRGWREDREGSEVTQQLLKIFQRSSYADLLAWISWYLQSTKEREFFCKGNLMIRVRRLNTCKRKPKRIL